jgi:hypothetical protein
MKLIFDTSGINALADDRESTVIVRGLPSAYLVGVTETVIAEVAANSNEARRLELLRIIERLLKFGMCVNPFHVIIERQGKAYLADRSGYEWRRVNVRFPEAEGEVVRQEVIHLASEETREALRKWDKDFRAIFSNARPAFQKLFDNRSGQRPSLQEVTDRMLGEGGAHRDIAINLFERGTGKRLSEAEVQDFTQRCLPFKALLIALCFSQYDRCIRDEREESLGKAGRLDMFSAVYLAYCKLFVTNDEGQCKALKTVAGMIGKDTEVVLYSQFKAKLFGFSVGAE